jgi:hypothetical protein
MNKDYVLYNLREAQQALGSFIAEIETDPDYSIDAPADDTGCWVQFAHIYHHLNTAWNARDASEAATNECSEEDFFRWRRFPSEDEMHLVP